MACSASRCATCRAEAVERAINMKRTRYLVRSQGPAGHGRCQAPVTTSRLVINDLPEAGHGVLVHVAKCCENEAVVDEAARGREPDRTGVGTPRPRDGFFA